MKLSLPQRFHKYYDKKHNFEIIKKELNQTDADLMIFPEMFLTGYRIRDRTLELAEPINSDLIKQLSSAAKKNKCALIFGMPERDAIQRGRIFNTAVFIDKLGKINQYRKFYLVNFGPFEDKRYFHEGLKLPILKVDDIKLGIIICYDIYFPELTKMYALQGVDLIVCISAAPTVTRQFFEMVIPARAVESTVFFAYVNLIGAEKNMTFWGGNTVVNGRGKQLVKGKYFKEDDVEVEIDPSELEFVRANRPTLRDSRIEVFKAIMDQLQTKVD
jgi:predicted amidohydrolase